MAPRRAFAACCAIAAVLAACAFVTVHAEDTTPDSCVEILRSWDAAKKECVQLPEVTGANCTWMDITQNNYETTLMWTVLNACKSKRPLLIAKIMADDVGQFYTSGFTKLPYAQHTILSHTNAPGGTDIQVLFTSEAGPNGQLRAGKPLTLCNDAALGRGLYCLIAGNDTSKAFETERAMDGKTVTLKGAVVGGKPKTAKECGKALHPAAVPFDWSQDCRPGCGMILKLTQC